MEPARYSEDLAIPPRPAGYPVPLSGLALSFCRKLQVGESRISKRSCTTTVRIAGSLDFELLRAVIESVIHRHESLRSRVVDVDGIPHLQVDPPGEFQLTRVEVPRLAESSPEEVVTGLLEEFAAEIVGLSVGPLFAARLFRLSEGDHVLICAMEHSIADGTSLGLFDKEVWTQYRHRAAGSPYSPPALPVQYGDYLIWLQQTYDSWLKQHRGYWNARLTDAPRVYLPRSDTPATVESMAGSLLRYPFGETASRGLKDIAQHHRIPLPLVVLAIYVVTMARWCGQDDLVVVFVSNARYRPELHTMIGFLASFLHLRIQVAETDTFLGLLRKITVEFYRALSHQDFNRVPDFIPSSDPSGLTELHFNWLPRYGAQPPFDYGGKPDDAMQVRPFQFRPMLPRTFVTLFSETDDEINLLVNYFSHLFPHHTVLRFARTMRQIAEVLASAPTTLIGRHNGLL